MASSLDDPSRSIFLSLFGEAPKKRVESQEEERDISASTSAETPREAAQQPQPSAPVQHPSHPSTAPAARHLDAINVDALGVPKLSTLCLQKLRAQRTRVVVDANIPDSQLKTVYQGGWEGCTAHGGEEEQEIGLLCCRPPTRIAVRWRVRRVIRCQH